MSEFKIFNKVTNVYNTLYAGSFFASNVKVTGETILNDLSVLGLISFEDLVVNGNLTVNGTQTIVNSEVLNVLDPIMTLHYNFTGIPTDDVGFEVERGDLENVRFVWDEGDQVFKSGVISNLKQVANLQNNLQNDGITIYNSASKELQTSASLTFSQDTNTLVVPSIGSLTNTLNINSQYVKLNASFLGDPDSNVGIYINRNDLADASLIWDELTNSFKCGLAGYEKKIANVEDNLQNHGVPFYENENLQLETVDKFIFDPTSTYLGVGTTAPLANLHVRNQTNTNNAVLVENNVGSASLVVDASGNTLVGASSNYPSQPFNLFVKGSLGVQNTSGTSVLAVTESGTVGIGTPTPHAGAILDLVSSTKGFVVPRIASLTTVPNPTNGMIVYQYDRLQLYAASSWRTVGFGDGNVYGALTANYIPLAYGSTSITSSMIFQSGSSSIAIGASSSLAASAIFELVSTTKGFLPPRFDPVNFTNLGTAAVPGLVVYNKDAKRLSVYDGTNWLALGTGDGSGNVIGSFTSGYVPVASGPTSLGNSMIYQSGTSSVAIGASSSLATSAILELVSSTKGFLPPRFTNNNIATMGTSAVEGLVVYNTETDRLSVYNGANWLALGTGDGNVSGSFTSGYVPLATGGTSLGDSMIYQSGTSSVAIGASSSLATSAILELVSSTKGFLPPRFTNENIINMGTSAVEGLVVYNKEADRLSVYNGATWLALGTGDGNVSGSFTTGYLPLATGGTSLGDSMIFQSGSASIAIGGTSSLATSAILELVSSTKGFLPPRFTNANIGSMGTSVAEGLVVYNSEAKRLSVYNGSTWLALGTGDGSGNVSGSFTSGYLPLATGATSLGDSILFQSGSNFLSIGTSSAVGKVTILANPVSQAESNTLFNAASQATLYLRRKTNETTGFQSNTSYYGASIFFGDNVGTDQLAAGLSVVQTTTDDDQCGLAFFTHSGTSTDSTVQESMRITHDGKVGIGTTFPARQLTLSGASLSEIMFEATSGGSNEKRWAFGNTGANFSAYTVDDSNGLGINWLQVTRVGTSSISNVAFPNGTIAIGTLTPNSNAILDLVSTNKALLLPRVGTTSVTTPTNGMVVYNSNDRLALFAGGNWQNVGYGDGNLSGTLTTGNIPLATGSTSLGTSIIYQTGTTNKNVGVGTSSPVSALQVGTSNFLSITNNFISSSIGGWLANSEIIGFNASVDATGNITCYTDGSTIRSAFISNQGGQLQFATYNASSGSDYTGTYTSIGTSIVKMVVNANGNVGIGTTSPNTYALLDLTSTNKGLLLPRLNTSSISGSTVPAGLIVYDSGAGRLSVYANSSWQNLGFGDGNLTGTLTSNYIPLATSSTSLGTSVIYQDIVNSRIAIGNTSPTVTLDVTGSANVSSTLTTQNLGVGLSTSPSARVHIQGTGTLQDIFRVDLTSGTQNFTIDTNGKGFFNVTPNTNAGVFNIYNTSITASTASNLFNNISQATLYLRRLVSDTPGMNNYGASLFFGNNSGTATLGSGISGIQTGTSQNEYGMAFFTHNSSIEDSSVQESMRITHDGKVGIGGASIPVRQLTLSNSSLSEIMFHTTSGSLNEKRWGFGNAGSTFSAYTIDDSNTTGPNWLQVTRSGTSISNVAFPNGNLGIGTITPNTYALLDLTSTNKGLLLPRLNTSSISGSTVPAGLIVYDSGSGRLSVYANSSWRNVGFGDGNLSGSLITNNIPLASGSTSLGTSIIYQSGTTSIGIGTTTPSRQLTLSNSALSEIMFEVTDVNVAANHKRWAFGNVGTTFTAYTIDDGNTTGSNWLQVTRSGTSISNVAFPNGKLGIGTSSPVSAFQVGSNNFRSFTMNSITAGTGGWLSNSDFLGLNASVEPSNGTITCYTDGTSVNSAFISNQGGQLQFATYTATSASDYTGTFTGIGTSIVKMVVGSDGNVGIGTLSPHTGAILDLVSTNKGFVVPRIPSLTTVPNPTNGMLVYQYDRLQLYAASSWRTVGFGDGNVYGVLTNNNIPLATGLTSLGTSIIYQSGTTSIGIGTSSPVSALQVGTINALSITNNLVATSGTGGWLANSDVLGFNASVDSSTGTITCYSDGTNINSAFIANQGGQLQFATYNATSNSSYTGTFTAIGTSIVKMVVNANGNVGIGTTSPNTYALLDLTSTNKGLLLPRLNTSSISGSTVPAGLIVYDSGSGRLSVFNGSSWLNTGTGDGNVSGSLVTNNIPRASGSTSLGTSIIYQNSNSFVGIGTSNPSRLLTLSSNSSSEIMFDITNTGLPLNQKKWVFGTVGTTFTAYTVDDFNSFGNYWLQVTRSGTSISNVAFPNGKLQVGSFNYGSLTTNNITTGTGGWLANSEIIGFNATVDSSNGTITCYTDGTTIRSAFISNQGGQLEFATYKAASGLNYTGTYTDIGTTIVKMVIGSDGNVGIGTLSPNTNAILDLVSTNKALLLPRVDTSLVTLPTSGMVVYSSNRLALYTASGGWQNLGFGDGNLIGSLTTGNLPLATGSTSLGTSIIYQTGSTSINVGIGTSSPVSALQVGSNNALSITNNFISSATANGWITNSDVLGFNVSVDTAGTITCYSDGSNIRSAFISNQGGQLQFATYNASSASDYTGTYTSIGTSIVKMVVNANGNVGIGTTAPNNYAILDLTSTNKGLLLPRLNTSSISGSTVPAGLIVYDSGSGRLSVYANSSWQNLGFGDGNITGTLTSGNVPLATGSTSLGTSIIYQTGTTSINVGVGTSSPVSALQVGTSNALSITNNFISSSTGGGWLANSEIIGFNCSVDSSNGTITCYTDGTTIRSAFISNQGGQLQFATYNATAALNYTGTYTSIGTSIVKMVIGSNGNVGIGTTDPISKLHVNNGQLAITQGGEGLQLVGTASSGAGSQSFMAFYPNTIAEGRKGYFGFAADDSVDLSLYNQNTTGSLAFGTNNLKRMTINRVGNVSIMTDTPGNLYPPIGLITSPVSISGQPYGNGTYSANASSITSPFFSTGAFDRGSNYWSSQQGVYSTVSTSLGVYTGGISLTYDGSTKTYTGEWLQIQLPSSIRVYSFAITANNNLFTTTRAPRNFRLFGSTSGANNSWFSVGAEFTDQTFAQGETQTFVVDGVTAYKYYRLSTNKINNITTDGTAVQIAELRLYEVSNDSTTPPDSAFRVGSNNYRSFAVNYISSTIGGWSTNSDVVGFNASVDSSTGTITCFTDGSTIRSALISNQDGQLQFATYNATSASDYTGTYTAIGTSIVKMVIGSNGNVGIGITAPDSNAILDLVSTNKALLLPRISLTSNIATPTNGMIVYSGNRLALYANDSWKNLGYGDLTGSMTNNYIPVATGANTLGLSAIYQASSTSLGIGTITPDANALLDLVSTNKALLLPRISLTSNIATPTNGMIVYSGSRVAVYAGDSWKNLGYGDLTGSMTTNYIPVANGTSSLTISTIYQDSNSRIGIGTTIPAFKLDVSGQTESTIFSTCAGFANGTGRPSVGTNVIPGEIHSYGCGTTTTLSTTADDGFLRLSAGGGGSTTTKSYIDLSGTSSSPDMDRNITFGTVNTERMRIDNVGNVGIGTNAPLSSTKVHIREASNDCIFYSQSIALGKNVIHRLHATYDGTSAQNGNAIIQLGNKSDPTFALPDSCWYFGMHSSAGSDFAPPLKLGFKGGSWGVPGDGDFMTFLTSGNVGIGTTSPAFLLDVNGESNSDKISTCAAFTNSTTRPTVGTSVIPGEIHSYGCGTTTTLSTTADDGFLRLSAGGGGSTTTKSYIDLSGTSSISDMDRNITFGTVNTERMRISNSGNVGIGTTTPNAFLDLLSPSTNSSYLLNIKKGFASTDASITYSLPTKNMYMVGTSDSVAGLDMTFTALASSNSASSFARYAFNGSDTINWSSSTTNAYSSQVGSTNEYTYALSTYTTGGIGGEWIQIQSNVPFKANSFLIRSMPGTDRIDPCSVYVFGSTDGTSWSQLSTNSLTFTNPNTDLTTSFSGTNSTFYTYYRLVIRSIKRIAAATFQYAFINELRFLGVYSTLQLALINTSTQDLCLAPFGYGRVGVGTISPVADLHVNGAFAITGAGGILDLVGTSTSGRGSHCYMEFYPNTLAQGRKAFFGFGNDDSVDLSLYNQNASGSIFFGTNSLTRMKIDQNGNVGIGTTNPVFALDVVGESNSDKISTCAAFTNSTTRPTVGTSVIPGEIHSYGCGTTTTLGTTFDDGFLRLSAGGGSDATTKSYIDLSGFSNLADMNRTITFGTNGVERMRINNSGNVGIGTTTPDSSLDVYMSPSSTTFPFTVKKGFATSDLSTTYTLPYAGIVGTSNTSSYYDLTFTSSASSGAAYLVFNGLDDPVGWSSNNTTAYSQQVGTSLEYNYNVAVSPVTTAGITGEYLQIYCNRPFKANQFQIRSVGNTTRTDPSVVYVFGSTDGTNWLQIYNNTTDKLSFLSGNTTITKSMTNSTFYNYYRLVIRSLLRVGGSILQYVFLNELSFQGVYSSLPIVGVDTSNNTCFAPFTAGNVGVGTTNPAVKMHLRGQSSLLRLTCQVETGDGDYCFMEFHPKGDVRALSGTTVDATIPRAYVGFVNPTNNNNKDFSIVNQNILGKMLLQTSNQDVLSLSREGVDIVGNYDCYKRLTLNGGNSTGALYGAFHTWGDGIHLGYNFYSTNINSGPPNFTWSLVNEIPNKAGATSRIQMSYGFIALHTAPNGGVPENNALLIDQNGNVGIGTSVPISKMHITDDTTITYTSPGSAYPPAALTSNSTTLSGQAYGNGLYVASASTTLSLGSSDFPYEAFDTVTTNSVDKRWASDFSYGAGTSAVYPESGTMQTFFNRLTTDTQSPIRNPYKGEWLQLQLPAAIFLYSFTLTALNSTPTYSPRTFRLFGSTNGTLWISVGPEFVNETFTINQTKTYIVDSNISYNYYRLGISAVNGSGPDPINYCAIAEMKFYERSVSNVFCTRDDKVGLGTTSPAYRLQLSTDSAAKPGTNTWTVPSDKRLKENIELADLDICYDNVKNLPLKRYKYKDFLINESAIRDRTKLGWIAQDVEQVFPKAISVTNSYEIEDCRGLDADQLYAAMYGSVQKLMQKVEALEADRSLLLTEVALLRSMIVETQSKLDNNTSMTPPSEPTNASDTINSDTTTSNIPETSILEPNITDPVHQQENTIEPTTSLLTAELSNPENSTTDPTSTQEPTPGPTSTQEPTQEPTSDPTSIPEPTQESIQEPTTDSISTQEPTSLQEPTTDPISKEEPSTDPTSTQEPTQDPTSDSTSTQEPTQDPTQEQSTDPISIQEPTNTPDPTTESSLLQEATNTPETDISTSESTIEMASSDPVIPQDSLSTSEPIFDEPTPESTIETATTEPATTT